MEKKEIEKLAGKIRDAVLDDIKDRSGMDWGCFDLGVQRELKAEVKEVIRKVLDEALSQ